MRDLTPEDTEAAVHAGVWLGLGLGSILGIALLQFVSRRSFVDSIVLAPVVVVLLVIGAPALFMGTVQYWDWPGPLDVRAYLQVALGVGGIALTLIGLVSLLLSVG